MIYEGIDTAARITAEAARKLKALGFAFAARYLVPETLWKALTAAEAADIRGAGLALMLCFELGGEDVKGGAVTGAGHGVRARQLAEKLGVPSGTVIYFACDYNPPEADFAAIEDYLKAARTAMGGKYEAGLYGPERIVAYLSGRGTVKRFWQCVAWSNAFHPAAALRQYAWQGDERARRVAEQIGVAVDLDAADTLSGMWMPGVVEFAEDDGGVIVEHTQAVSQGAHWYDEAMAWAKKEKLINDGRPNDPVTRAELATILQRFDKRMDEKIKIHLPEDDYSIGTKG